MGSSFLYCTPLYRPLTISELQGKNAVSNFHITKPTVLVFVKNNKVFFNYQILFNLKDKNQHK